jgi:hypothetical protein
VLQGLNRLAAVALLFLSEVDAFWCLVAIVEHLMPEQYYSPRLVGPQVDQVSSTTHRTSTRSVDYIHH